MTLRTIIVDDEFHAVENLKRLIAKYCPQLTVSGVAYSSAEARTLIREQQPDLVFLDIKMPDGNGMELVAEMEHRHFMVIFVTAFDEFAVRAFKLGALDYILKPVDYQELAEAEKRAIRFYQSGSIPPDNYTGRVQHTVAQLNDRQPAEYICVPQGNDFIMLKLPDIVALQAAGAYTRIYTLAGKDYLTSRNLGFYEEVLYPGSFFRIHKSSIVNLQHIRKVDRNERMVILKNEMALSVSFRAMADFMAKLKSQSA
jgi:two-component system, LytTR family, response regulator